MPDGKYEKPYIKQIAYLTKECIEFSAGGYKAVMIPEVGANVIQLKDVKNNLSLLRTPEADLEFEKFKSRPQVYGLPLLFPPNRIEDGKFRVGDRKYQFPINEPARNNYIHGFIKNEEWKIDRMEVINDGEVEVEACFNYDSQHEFYKYFPHEFQANLIYNLSCDGLRQTISITNKSSVEMPLGIGFHTSFNVPFRPESEDKDCKLIASIDKRWEQDDRNLPTSRILELTDFERDYINEGAVVKGKPIEAHYILKPIRFNGQDFKGAIFEDKVGGFRLFYEMGQEYKHIVIWNDMGNKDYVCVEPQTWAINAPNLDFSDDITGFKTIKPGNTWNEICKIYVQNI